MRKLTEPRYLTVGTVFVGPQNTPVELVRDWKLVKALHRHGTWAKNKIADQIAANNAALLKP